MNRRFIKIAIAFVAVLQTTILLAQSNCSGTYSNGPIANYDSQTNSPPIPDVDIIEGLYTGDGLGYDVSNIGDFNNDGLDDISISATFATPSVDPTNPMNNLPDQEIGEIYIIFGELNYSNLNLSQLGQPGGPKGFKIPGVTKRDRLGYGGANGIGDINGDGFDDLVVSSPYPDPNTPPPPYQAPNVEGFASGTSYIIFGALSVPVNSSEEFDLTSLNGNNGFTITGTHYYENVGTDAGPAGDFNNDGIDDFFVTSDDSWISGASVGALFLIYGKTTGFLSSYEAHELGTGDALVIVGDDSGIKGDNFGITAAPLNDINGDGISDLLIGASYANADQGGGYVIFGSDGENPFANSFPVAYNIPAGSIPGYPVSMYNTDPGNIVMMLNVNQLDGTNGFAIIGSTVDGGFGTATGDAGDLNNDGINDLFICGYKEDITGINSNATGACYIIYGRSLNESFEPIINVGVNGHLDGVPITAETGLRIFGENSLDFFGYSASSIGDFNGDLVQDIIVGAIFTDFNGPSSGSVYVIYGQNGGFGSPTIDLSTAQGFRLDGEVDKAWLGFSVDGLLDLNGDSHKEIIVGSEFARLLPIASSYARPPGRAYIINSKCKTCARVVEHLSDLHIECRDEDGATIVLEAGNPNNVFLEGATSSLTYWITHPLYSDRFYYNKYTGYYYFEGLPEMISNVVDNNCGTTLTTPVTECVGSCAADASMESLDVRSFCGNNNRIRLWETTNMADRYDYQYRLRTNGNWTGSFINFPGTAGSVAWINGVPSGTTHIRVRMRVRCSGVWSPGWTTPITFPVQPCPLILSGGGLFGDVKNPKLSSLDGYEITIHPNPTKGMFAINFKELEIEKATVRMYNLAGKLVKEKQITANESIALIDASALSDGMYLVKVFTNSGEQLFADKLTIAH